jgi:hypothetical protein
MNRSDSLCKMARGQHNLKLDNFQFDIEIVIIINYSCIKSVNLNFSLDNKISLKPTVIALTVELPNQNLPRMLLLSNIESFLCFHLIKMSHKICQGRHTTPLLKNPGI